MDSCGRTDGEFGVDNVFWFVQSAGPRHDSCLYLFSKYVSPIYPYQHASILGTTRWESSFSDRLFNDDHASGACARHPTHLDNADRLHFGSTTDLTIRLALRLETARRPTASGTRRPELAASPNQRNGAPARRRGSRCASRWSSGCVSTAAP